MSKAQHPILLFMPYPTISPDGELSDGTQMAQCEFCRFKCEERVCAEYSTSLGGKQIRYFTCPHGYSVATAEVGGIPIRINGVLETFSSTASPQFKKAIKDSRKLKADECEAWVYRAWTAIDQYELAVRENAASAVAALHDVKSLIGGILHTAEEWIQQYSGYSMDEQVETAPKQLKTIYHACRLLIALLQYTDMVANPDAATFGKPSWRGVHGVFFSCAKILEARANKRGIQIKLTGKSINKAEIRESFGIIPLVLMDNAIKYADPNSIVELRFEDQLDESVAVVVASTGTLVPRKEWPWIFDKGFRGSNATAAGSGLGLHIARLVADAHATKIAYEASDGPVKNGKGENRFSVVIRGKRPY